MQKQEFDVLAVGDGCLDVILTGLDGSLYQKDIHHGSCQHVIAGGGFTTPVVLQRLGAKVTWAVDFGNDMISQYIMGSARDEGVDLSFSKQSSREIKRISVSMSNKVNRSFLSFEDKNPFFPAAFFGLLKAKAKAVYMPGTRLDWMFIVGASIARMRKLKIIVDGNGSEKYHIGKNFVKSCLKLIDILLLNSDEAKSLSGTSYTEDALLLLSKHCRLVVLKDGANGALVLEGGKVKRISAIPVTAVDTTGAGDSFNAGFMAGWLKGLPIAECVAWANITAGLSTTKPGGATMKVNLANILLMMKELPQFQEGNRE